MDFSAPNRSTGPTGDSLESSEIRHAELDLAPRFGDRIRVFAARRISDPAAAEDIAQETLRTIVIALRENKIQNLDALPGFVFTTARNLCMHWVRSSVREASALRRLHLANTERNGPPSPLDCLIDEDKQATVRAAVNQLSLDDKQLLTTLYYEGLTSDEAATLLGITAAAVRVRKHRALQRLARLLGEDADGNTTDEAGTLD